MPSIYQLKPAFQNALRPLVKILFNIGISANQVTVSAMLISVLLSVFLYVHFLSHPTSWLLILFPLWMLCRMAFNAIDGMLAREFNQQSKLGAFYNELCDVIADTALFLSVVSLGVISTPLLLLFSFLAILSEYSGVMAPLIGAERRYDGPMGKSDRAFWFSLMVIVIWLFPHFSDHPQGLIYFNHGLLSLMSLLLLRTIFNRIKNSL